MSCQVIGDTISVSHASGAIAGSIFSNENVNINGSSEIVSGWMYLNQVGQMCGPYVSQQLSEGLLSGFLPDDLPVYPVMNGSLMVAVPLKLFKDYPDHVSTGFTYLSRPADTASTATSTVVEQQQSLTWEDKCWMYRDDYGRPAGPYSLSELYYWRQCGYLTDSVMIYHVENESSPSTLVSLINSCPRGNLTSSAIPGHVNSGHVELISKVSEEIGSQLHAGIMKARRRLVLDEIIGDFVVDFVAKKKARKQLKTEQDSNGFRCHLPEDEKKKDGAEERNDFAALTSVVTCHDVSTPQYSAFYCTEEPTKHIGDVENFQAAKTVVSQRLFNHCREVLWNAVFYDLVGDCAISWRKSRRWSRRCMDEVTALSKQSTSVQLISDVMGQTRGSDSPEDELDCPPGFPVCTGSSNDREKTITTVQEELFLASKASMVDFVRTCVEDEALKLSNLLKDSQMNEVSTQISEQPCNITDGEEPTSSAIAQDLDSGHISIDDSPLQGISSPHQPALNPCKQSSFNFLGSSFSRLGAPCSIAVDDQTPDEPPPPGLAGPITEPCPQLQRNFLNQLRKFSKTVSSTQKGSVGSYEDCSTEFIGRAFKRLGMPSRSSVDDQRTEEPPPPGSQSGPSDMYSSGSHKFRRLVFDVSVPKWRKFVILALCRQKLHDDVLKEWKVSFHDGLRGCLKQRDQEKTLASEKMANFTCAIEPEALTERSKSCHSSGPSEVSVVEFTYSRRKVSKMLATPVSLKDFQSSKCGKSTTKKLARAEALGLVKDKNAADQLCLKEEVSASKTSKVEASVKRKLTKNGQPVKSLNNQKRQRVAGSSPSTAAKDYLKIGVEKVVDAEMDSNDTREPASRHKVTRKDKLAIDRLQLKKKSIAAKDYPKSGVEKVVDAEMDSNDTGEPASSHKVTGKDKLATDHMQLKKKSSDISKLKRKYVVDESQSPSPQSKAAKHVKVDAKQASCKKAGKGRTQPSKSKNCCPMSSGCARSSIDGWEWRKWSLNARPAERARVRGIKLTTVHHFGSDSNTLHSSHAKGISARTNRVKLRNLLAAAEGAEILKASQLKARKKRLRFQRSKIHDWGLIALEPIEAEDFVIEYVGELIRPGISDIREREYEKMGIGSSYLFRLDDGYVVDATKRGGIARFINHSCEPNCYTKTVTVDGQKRIFIYAKRLIASGEEITYNYKFPLEEKKIPCNCRAKRCRGSMN